MLRWVALLLLTIGAAMCSVAAGAQAPATSNNTPPPSTPAPHDALEHLRQSTLAVGQVVDDGGKRRWVTMGSAVIVAIDQNHACIITAKHVVHDPAQGYLPTQMYVRVPQTSPSDATDFGVLVSLVDNGNDLWRSLPDGSDIAAVPLPNLSKYSDVHGISEQDFGTDEDIYQGASVIVFGYPVVLGEDYLSTPIARGGIIAWTDPDGPTDRPFLIDANVFNGNSGGPVFHSRSGFSKEGGLVLGGGMALIGIVVADAAETVPVTAGSQPVTVLDSTSGRVARAETRVLNIGGIGIVEPVSKIRKLLTMVFSSP